MMLYACYIAIFFLLIQLFAIHNKMTDLQEKLHDAETRVKNAEKREDAIIDVFIKSQDNATHNGTN